ncbi:MAG TPA: PEP-CTERM sorting domain-containing protein [Gemmatimonadales bacterium]
MIERSLNFKRVAWMAAGAAALSAVPARADFKSFDSYCTSAGFVVCASVHLTTYQDGSQWKLQMDVWNLNGVLGDPHRITALALYHLGEPAWSGSYSLESVTYNSDPIESYWNTKGGAGINGAGIQLEIKSSTEQQGDGIIGCTDPSSGGTHWSTCAPNGPVVFTFNTSTEFQLSNAQVRWHSQSIGPNGDQSLKCDTGLPNGNLEDDGTYDSFPPCSVVPEPVTMTLLATGLAGMGGVGVLRRRRKKGSDIETA